MPYHVFVSTLRAMRGGRVRRDELLRSENGQVLCRWCNLEVPARRSTFCSDWCVNEWRIRSDPGHLRQLVLERDQGVCSACQLDCVAEYLRIRRLRGLPKAKALRDWRARGRKSLWDADHILPVVEGGGECDLANLRTLCLKCHRKETAELCLRRRARRSTTAKDQAVNAFDPSTARG